VNGSGIGSYDLHAKNMPESYLRLNPHWY
jgi:hypothetical protein